MDVGHGRLRIMSIKPTIANISEEIKTPNGGRSARDWEEIKLADDDWPNKGDEDKDLVNIEDLDTFAASIRGCRSIGG